MIEAPSYRRAHIRGSAWKSYPSVCLAVSVGKAVHEGTDLEAAINMLVATQKPCVIRVSDTLQRHNLMAAGMDVRAARQRSHDMGDEWLERNAHLFARFALPPIVVRWDDVINHSDFDAVHTAFILLSKRQGMFSEALSRDVNLFLSRRSNLSHEEMIIAEECSRGFLLEELAGQTLLGRRYSYARFYPGKPAEVLELVRDGKINEAPRGLENTAFVRFSLKTHARNVVDDNAQQICAA